jgi:O-methyltransferase
MKLEEGIDNLRSRLREALADASLYAGAKQIGPALDILAEDEEDFAHAPDLAHEALVIINAGFIHFVTEETSDASAAARAIEQFFRMAATVDRDVRDINPILLGFYKRALLITKTSARPLRRVCRQTSLVELLRTTSALDGALAECGCARGMSSMQMAYSIAASNPQWRGERFYICDSFQGLSEPSAEDLDMSGMERGEAKRVMSMTFAGSMSYPFKRISELMWSQFPALSLHKGWIPDVFDGLPETKYRFVNVDVDLYAPTRASFEYFYPRLTKGGVIVTDDYNWPGGRKAVDEFCVCHGLTLQFTKSKLAYLVAD